DELEIKAY
nr:Chain B, ASP-GLU-LEU-GLU-ILE-LYS-ALA-TYR [Homo sapiens]